MTMIPGTMEPRRAPAAAGNLATPAEPTYARAGAGQPADTTVQRAELPGWWKVAIFAAVLIAVMWLVMSVF